MKMRITCSVFSGKETQNAVACYGGAPIPRDCLQCLLEDGFQIVEITDLLSVSERAI